MEEDQGTLEANGDASRPQALLTQRYDELLEDLDRLASRCGIGELDDRYRGGQGQLWRSVPVRWPHRVLRNSDRAPPPASIV